MNIEYLTAEDLHQERGGEMLLDWEVYPNFALCGIESYQSRKIFNLEITETGYFPENLRAFRDILNNFTIVTFNGNHYDILLCQKVHSGIFTLENLNRISQASIAGQQARDTREEFKIPNTKFDHIDLKEVCPLTGSLKLYAGRLHASKIQELPFDPGLPLSPDQVKDVIEYNVNDLDCTGLVRYELSEQIEMRRKLTDETGIDVRSKSDAQIAEAIIVDEVERELGRRVNRPEIAPGTIVRYKAPSFLHFKSPELKQLLADVCESEFVVEEVGSVSLPASLSDRKIYIGSGTYRLGIGGLHSSEQRVCYRSNLERVLCDTDVASYYPAIIMALRLFPRQMGEVFLEIYQHKIDIRLAAKAAKSVLAEVWKIVLNGTFGKSSNKWSKMYSPKNFIHIVLTGQLALLMLIEMLEESVIPVVSANTDGVLSYPCRNQLGDFHNVLTAWQLMTGFKLEETRYKAVYSRDVNSYIALKEDGKYKTKGAYKNPWDQNYGMPPIFRFHGNPNCQICTEAVVKFLGNGTPISDTIRTDNDFRKFLILRTVKGGALQDGRYIGKVVRWYYGMNGDVLKYQTSGNKVPDSDGAIPCMELPDGIPTDLDYGRYEKIAGLILEEIGYTGGNLFNA